MIAKEWDELSEEWKHRWAQNNRRGFRLVGMVIAFVGLILFYIALRSMLFDLGQEHWILDSGFGYLIDITFIICAIGVLAIIVGEKFIIDEETIRLNTIRNG